MYILNSVIFMFSLSLIFGVLIAVFARTFEIKVDPRVACLVEILPAYNCGACGYPGCEQYAAALVSGHVPPNKCAPGGHETAVKVRECLDAKTVMRTEGSKA
jgi:electron transport complex protein RnfB